MKPDLQRRVAYGRTIRDRAACLIEAHGGAAETEARLAAARAGSVLAERRFWEAVAARVVRVSAPPRRHHAF